MSHDVAALAEVAWIKDQAANSGLGEAIKLWGEPLVKSLWMTGFASGALVGVEVTEKIARKHLL